MNQELLLDARELGNAFSTCKRRKIGCFVSSNLSDESKLMYLGWNAACEPCEVCTRLTSECPAEHAEVGAVLPAMANNAEAFMEELVVFAEVPCLSCLSFIRERSSIRKIYCIDLASYIPYYPPAAMYHQRVEERLKYAHKLGFTVIQLSIEFFK